MDMSLVVRAHKCVYSILARSDAINHSEKEVYTHHRGSVAGSFTAMAAIHKQAKHEINSLVEEPNISLE